MRFKKILEESEWVSGFAPRYFDRQGDLSWIFQILGPELARTLGFGWTVKGEILAPDPQTFNLRINEFNRFLEQLNISPIPIRYYAQSRESIRDYLDEFRQERVPVSQSMNHHTSHDYAFHAGNVLNPPEISQLLATEAAIALRWRTFIAPRTNLANFNSTHVGYSVSLVDGLSTFANRLDHSTIRIRRALKTFLLKPVGKLDRSNIQLERISRLSPVTAFVARLSYYRPDVRSLDPSEKDRLFVEWNSVRLRLTEHFMALTLAEHPEWHIPIRIPGVQSADDLIELYNRRARELKQAASAFLETRPIPPHQWTAPSTSPP